MLRYIFVLFILIEAVWAQKINLDSRRKQILSIVDEELHEVTRISKQENFSSPDTLLRISELYLEKARLWREAENENYLAIPPEQRRNLKKNDYFKTSAQFFDAANEHCHIIIKRFPKYKGIGEVYYILAFNYKELGNTTEAQKYFSLASGNSAQSPKVGYKSKLALADFNFNAHKYSEAIPLYEVALGKLDEKWWTKDAFNLAWSYYRVKLYDKAITLMKDVHRKSSSDKYINMKASVERDIAIFFVDAGRINEAVKFYESLGINYTDQFVKIANTIINQGRFTQAEALLDQAAKLEKNRDKRISIHLTQLDLFDKYNKIEEHLVICRELLKQHEVKSFSDDDLKRFSYHVDKKAAELQKATASDVYKQVPRVQKQKSQQAIAYFEMAAQLQPQQKAEKIFFQGETAYAVGDFGNALNLYIRAFDEARTGNDKKISAQSLEGMLSSLGQNSLDKKIAERYYVPVYSRYLIHDAKSSRASAIYVKLFNSQYDSGDLAGAEKTLNVFAHNFPGDENTQEGMLAKIMEHYRAKKDYAAVKRFMGQIDDGKYRVSKKYAEALKNLMTKIQIEGVQQSLERGEKDVALKGYHQIYQNPDSTAKAKINAAYNLSALYYELGDSQSSYQWAVTALKDMDLQDVVKFSDSFLSISAGLFLKQRFDQSADLSHRILAKLCKENSSNKSVAYKNAVFIALANEKVDKAMEVKDLGKTCMIPDAVITEVTLELIKDLVRLKRWQQVETELLALENNSKNVPFLIKPYEELRKSYLALGDNGQARQIEEKQHKFYNTSRTQKLDVPVEALDLMAAKYMANIHEAKIKLDQIGLRFPESEFNNSVKMKLQMLDQMALQVNAIQKTGSGKGIVEAYKIVIAAYEEFATKLREFSPEGKSPEYVTSFQKAMSEVYNPILLNAAKQRAEVRKLIIDNKILTPSNFHVLFDSTANYKRFLSLQPAVVMDRGGRK
jgi:hypothetical protein